MGDIPPGDTRRDTLRDARQLPLTEQMTENPYQSPSTSELAPKNRASRRLIWCGVATLALAAACLAATVFGMMLSFHSIANSTTSPTASELASGIRIASLPSIAAGPLALLGIVLVVAGAVVRQRAAA